MLRGARLRLEPKPASFSGNRKSGFCVLSVTCGFKQQVGQTLEVDSLSATASPFAYVCVRATGDSPATRTVHRS